MNTSPYHQTFFLLGCYILVRCKYQSCLKGITDYFSNSVCEPWCTPDVIIDCDWQEPDRYLFRSRPEKDGIPLKGVRVHTPKNIANEDWSFSSPPMPPFIVEPFRNRFVGLHGASVKVSDNKCLIIIGHQGSGKTTSSVELVNNYGCQLLTDETVLIHKRTRLVEPFPRAIGIKSSKNSNKVALPASTVCSQISSIPALATHIIFLEPNSGNQSNDFSLIKPSETLKKFLYHHLDVGCNPEDATVTLFHLAREIVAASFRYNSYEDLKNSVSTFIEFTKNS